jgi:hypothetical protein
MANVATTQVFGVYALTLYVLSWFYSDLFEL